MRAPLVLFCNNNGWAISTPVVGADRAEALVDKAVGYGMPGVRVDGGDVLAVYEATREAVERARAGDGPTFVEAVSYRAAPHATADDPRAYIDLERVEEEKRNECLGRYERYLQRLGVLSDEQAQAVRDEAAEVMRAGIAAAEAEPDADVSLLFEHAFVDAAGIVRVRPRRAPRLAVRSAGREAEDVSFDGRAAARRGGQRRAPHGDGARRRRDGHGRGRRARRRRLPRDRRPARPVRAGPLRRHAARRGRDPRHRRRPLHGRLAAR